MSSSIRDCATPKAEIESDRDSAALSQNVPLGRAIRTWAKIGWLSFGGPAGQIALMHRIVVDENKWISENRFLHALNFCMILPGPEAQQLATYVGWLLHGFRGGVIAGTLFIVPGFIVILALSYLYVTAGSLPAVQGLFVGFKAAVVAIVLQAVVRIGRRSLESPLLTAIAATAFVAAFVFRTPFPYIVATAATIGCVTARFNSARTAPNASASVTARGAFGELLGGVRVGQALKTVGVFAALWLGPVTILIGVSGTQSVFATIGVFFSKMAVVTFGGAYAVLSYVAHEAVQVHGWLTPAEMIDGLALAETTPGPLIQVVQFVGFMAAYRNPGVLPPLVAGLLGSIFTTWVTFVPCFLWIFLGAPHMERLRQNKLLTGAFSSVTAAVVGVVANLAIWFAFHSIFSTTTATRVAGVSMEIPILSSIEIPALLITLTALAMVFRFRASVLATLATTGVLGVASFLS